MEQKNDYHRMGRRCWRNKYSRPGIYHVTIHVDEALRQPLGRIAGDLAIADGEAGAPHVELSAIGRMVEEELTTSITAHYPFIEVQEHVVMPEHLHFILRVHNSIISVNGRETHLGQVIAGFKKGCNRRFWEIMGVRGEPANATEKGVRGEPASATGEGKRGDAAEARGMRGEPASATEKGMRGEAAGAAGMRGEGEGEQGSVLRVAVRPQGSMGNAAAKTDKRTPSWGTTDRQPLFAAGYVDVMPLSQEQLEVQRQYILNNPRSRLQRMRNRAWLQTQHASTPTALSMRALRGYLQRECAPSQFSDEIWERIRQQLLDANGMVVCDSYGNLQLLKDTLLPVVCHRKDARWFPQQMQRCLEAAQAGAVLVSARIAGGEQQIMDEAMRRGFPVVLVADNGFPERYHPSARQMEQCGNGTLLLLTPWKYHYRPVDTHITVAECKTMNCAVQAICRRKDDWWQTFGDKLVRRREWMGAKIEEEREKM